MESHLTTPTIPHIIKNIRLDWSTRDSMGISWSVRDEFRPNVIGFKVSYQAIGSLIVQKSHMILPPLHEYSITHLHESTYYSICVRAFSNLTELSSRAEEDDQCIKMSTSINSFWVAVGSALGAFLVLAMIVLFVVIAKWQHNRKLRKEAALQGTLGRSMSMNSCDEEDDDNLNLNMENENGAGDIEANKLRRLSHHRLQDDNARLKLDGGSDDDLDAVVVDQARFPESYNPGVDGMNEDYSERFNDGLLPAHSNKSSFPVYSISPPHHTLQPTRYPGGQLDPDRGYEQNENCVDANTGLLQPSDLTTGIRPNLSCNW